MNIASDLSVGLAAEHLVCADLLLRGYRAFLAGQHCPYDVVVEIGAGRVIRLQVKSTRLPRSPSTKNNRSTAYLFFVRRAGRGGRREYGDGEFDAVALVALDIRRIAYMRLAGLASTQQIRIPGFPYLPRSGAGKHFDDFPFEAPL